MRQSDDKPGGVDAVERARVVTPCADNFPARVAALRIVIGAALFSGIMLSFNLWFPAARSFPRAPLFNTLPRAATPPVEYLLGSLLLTTLAAMVLARRPARFVLAVSILLTLLAALDQTRLQPWVYQYLLMLIVIALHGRQSRDGPSAMFTLSALQLTVAVLYFWSGVQKLNFSFIHEVLPQLLGLPENDPSLAGMHLSALGVGVAAVEMFTGGGLLFRRTRKLSVWLALAMHGLVLGLLIRQGHNSVVWPWNVALMLTVIILFWGRDTSIRQTFANWGAGNTYGHSAQILALGCAALPALSFGGWWDMNLSGALYSGNKAVAVVRIDRRIYEKLPAAARRQVFATKSGEQMLPFFEWSMAELNVPPYPEPRVFKQLTREICGSAGDESQTELIMRSRPAIFDGSYSVNRMKCSQLDE